MGCTLQCVVLGLLGLLTLAVFLLKRHYNLWKNMNAPNVPPKFPAGNLQGVGTKHHFSEFMREIYMEKKHEGPFVGLFFFIQPVTMVTDLELVKNVLVKDFNYFHERNNYCNEKDDPLSAHLASLSGTSWRQLRIKLTPTFTSGKMKLMYPIILEISQRFEKKLTELMLTGNGVDIKTIAGRFTMDVIGNCAFGIECNCLFGENANFHEMGLKSFKNPRFSPIVVRLLSSFKRVARWLRVKTVPDEISNFFLGVVNSTIEMRKSSGLKRNDFMDLLIDLMKDDSNSQGLTLEQITAQSFVFFLAGFETSSSLMTFCLYELSQNIDVQEKLRQHIEDVLEKHNGELTYEATMEMKYLDQVLNESLRMYPPASFLSRSTYSDYKVPNTNFTLPKDGMIMIPVYSIHRDPEYYTDPETFDPDRFAEEEVRKRPSNCFLPFGDGPRNCIGLRFGMMQARIGIIAIIRNFHVKLSNKTKVPMKINVQEHILGFQEKLYIDLEAVKK